MNTENTLKAIARVLDAARVSSQRDGCESDGEVLDRIYALVKPFSENSPRTIAILPTGDWAEICDCVDVQIVTLTAEQFRAMCDDDYSQNTILQIDASC